MEKIRILVIDDDEIVLRTMEIIFKNERFLSDIASDGDEGLRKFHDNDYDIIFLDLYLPDKHGIEILSEIRELKPDTSVVMISGYGQAGSVEAKRLQVEEYVEKPIDPDVILKLVDRIMEMKRKDR